MRTDTKLLSDYLSRSIAEAQNLIRLADTKANIVLILIGVILTLFFNTFVLRQNISVMHLYLVLIPFLISGLFSFLTLYPRIVKRSINQSLFYFKDAANLNIGKLSNKLSGNSEKYIIEDYINNIKALSIIISKKLFYLRLSYLFLAIAVLIKLLWELIIWLNIQF